MTTKCTVCAEKGVYFGNKCTVCNGLGYWSELTLKRINKRREEAVKRISVNSRNLVEFPAKISPHCPDF
jgi:DnaJ-class molecular chaperone